MDFPDELVVETSAGERHYVRAVNCWAVEKCSAEREVVQNEIMRLTPEIAIVECKPSVLRSVPESSVRAAYRLGENGPLAAPTGSVFIRLSKTSDLKNFQTEIAAAGFEIERLSPAGSYAGWVRHTSGQIGNALSDFPNLQSLPGVESVEPEMLIPRRRRR